MNILAKPTHLHCSPGCGALWMFRIILYSLFIHVMEMKSVFCTAGNVWWDDSTAWAMAISCSHCAGLLCWAAVAKKSWASMHKAHTLSCPLGRYKWFAASWVHWAACIQAKVCNSHELSVSGASAGNTEALSLIRSSILPRIVANFTLLPLSVKCYLCHWSCACIAP